jgi:hypothetical protein
VKAPPWETPIIGPTNTPADQLDLTLHGRMVIDALKVKDTDELSQMPPKKMREAEGYDTHIWDEYTRVLQGLGYDVSKRDELRYQW